MKKIQLLLSTLLVIIGSSFATSSIAQEVITLSESPTRIDVSSAISVEIIHAKKNEMQIRANQKDLETFSYKLKQRKLTLKRKKGTFSRRNDGSIKVSLYLTNIKDIKELEVSGASKISFADRLNNDKLEIDLSGASKADFSGTVDHLMLDLSGASKINTDGHFKRINVDLSGASKLDITGDFDGLKADISGASKFTHRGKGNTISIEISGASNFNGRKSFIKKASIEASGVSSATIHAHQIDSSKSGMSSINVLPYN